MLAKKKISKVSILHLIDVQEHKQYKTWYSLSCLTHFGLQDSSNNFFWSTTSSSDLCEWELKLKSKNKAKQSKYTYMNNWDLKY